MNHQYTYLPQLDGGIYLIKDGKPVDEPGQMLLIKNDPKYNESWPRAVVPYKRIYGVDEPKRLAALANDGKLSHAPAEGTPFGLVGTSSFYKRESYPNGVVPRGQRDRDVRRRQRPVARASTPFTSHGNGMPLNWHNQGADAGLYANDDIHAVRILAMEPTTDRNRGAEAGPAVPQPRQRAAAHPGRDPGAQVRRTASSRLDPDGNPDTSFLAKIPADTAFTFQTLDKHGMVLNMAQTWHQLRPGEIRNDCGGCHAHSQKPTDFEQTAAAQARLQGLGPDERRRRSSTDEGDATSRGKKWDAEDETGLRFAKAAPLERRVLPRHQADPRAELRRLPHAKDGQEPAGQPRSSTPTTSSIQRREPRASSPAPTTAWRWTSAAKFGHKPVGYD